MDLDLDPFRKVGSDLDPFHNDLEQVCSSDMLTKSVSLNTVTPCTSISKSISKFNLQP